MAFPSGALDYDGGELLIFQESTSQLLFPPRATHRFGRFPPPPNRWPSNNGGKGARASDGGSAAGGRPSQYQPNQHQQQHYYNNQYTSMSTGGSGGAMPNSASGLFPAAHEAFSVPSTPGAATAGAPANVASGGDAMNSNGQVSSAGSSAVNSINNGACDAPDDAHWTLVSEGAFLLAPDGAEMLLGGGGGGGGGGGAAFGGCSVGAPGRSPRLSGMTSPGLPHGQPMSSAALLDNGPAVSTVASSGFGSAALAARFSPSVLVSMTAMQQKMLYAEQQQQEQMRQALLQGMGGGSAFDLASALSTGPSLLTVGDRTLLVLSVGCPQRKVDVALVLWYSNSEKGVKPGFWFAQSAYLVEFLKQAAQELGFLPASPLSALHTNSINSNSGGGGIAIPGSALHQPHHHYSQTPASSLLVQQGHHPNSFAAAPSSSLAAGFPLSPAAGGTATGAAASNASAASNNSNSTSASPEAFLHARAALRERVRQLRLGLVPGVNQRPIAASGPTSVATLYFPITLPRSVIVGKTEREMAAMAAALQDGSGGGGGEDGGGQGVAANAALKHSWEAGKSFMFLSNPADPALLQFACSAIGYAIALSRASPLICSSTNGGSSSSSKPGGGVILPDLDPNFVFPTSSNNGNGATTKPSDLRTPTKQTVPSGIAAGRGAVDDDTGDEDDSMNGSQRQQQHQTQQQQQPRLSTLTELLALSMHNDLERASHLQRKLVRVDQLIAAIQFVHQHPGRARVVVLSKRDSATNAEDYAAACIFDVLRAVFRPAGRFAHSGSRDPALFARKILERDGGRPGHLWGVASLWTPLTHIEFSASFDPSAVVLMANASSASYKHHASAAASMVTEDAFFVPKLQSALDFGHTLLVVDCMNKQIFLAAPNAKNTVFASNAAASAAATTTAAATTATAASAASRGAGAVPPPLQPPSLAAAKPYVLSALPCASTFVDECRSMWEVSQQAAIMQAQQQSNSSGRIVSAAAAGASAASTLGVDCLRGLVDLAPVLRSMAEAELAQLLLRQGQDTHHNQLQPPQQLDATPQQATPPRIGGGADQQVYSQVLSMGSLSPMRTRSNLSSFHLMMPMGAASGSPQAMGGGSSSAVQSAYFNATTTTSLNATMTSTATAPQPGKPKGAMKGQSSAAASAQQQQQQQQQLLLQQQMNNLMTTFQSNDALFALII